MRILGTALLIGGGLAAVAAVVAAPQIFRMARPLVREGLKRGMAAYAQARAAAAEFVDDVEDLVAEVQAEVMPDRGAHAPSEPSPPKKAHG